MLIDTTHEGAAECADAPVVQARNASRQAAQFSYPSDTVDSAIQLAYSGGRTTSFSTSPDGLALPPLQAQDSLARRFSANSKPFFT